jgi:hypothetical protein
MKNVLSIEEVFAGRLLEVPDYQRGYAWGEEQLRDFIEDLELLGDGKEHYTGTLVLHPRRDRGSRMDSQGSSYISADIVDGQQRLTTIVLLLDAIRRELASQQMLESLADGIRSNYLSVRDISGQPLLRLKLNGDTNNYWQDEVLSDEPLGAAATIASHRRLSQAHELFRDYLAERRDQPDHKAWLLSLYEKVTQRLRMTLYEVGEAAEVGVIFEVMNDRGKPLTELEKVKNYLLYVASRLAIPGEPLAAEVNRSWAHVFETLMAAGVAGDAHENALLRAHWLITYDASPASWEGAKSIKRHFGLRQYAGRHEALLDELLQYTKRLRVAATAYVDVQVPSRTSSFAAFGTSDSTLRRLRRTGEKLRRLRLTASFTPVLMAARIARPAEADGYLKLLEIAERYAFLVYRLLERRSDAGFSSLARLGYDLAHDATFDDVVSRFEASLRYYAPAQRVRDALKLDSARNWYWWRGLRYFLYEYEEHLAKGDYVPLSWDVVESQELEKTIEHVLPQTPSDEYWQSRFTEGDRKALTHDLGNLVLTEHNPSLSNRPFPEKRGDSSTTGPCYCRSAIFQEKALCGQPDWTPDTVKRRRAHLVAWALDRWQVDEAEVGAAEVTDLAEVDVEQPEPDDELTEPPAPESEVRPVADEAAALAAFNAAMESIYDRAKREIGYNATRFLVMVKQHGGYETAKRLLADPEPHYGLAELFLAGRSDLSVEHHVLMPEFAPLFTADELAVARKRLGR